MRLDFHVHTKRVTIRGSVAVKAHAVLYFGTGTTNVRLIDRCMTEVIARRFIQVLTEGVAIVGDGQVISTGVLAEG